MFKSYQVGKIYGIPFKLDITFLLILPFFVYIIGVQIEQVVPLLNDLVGTTIDPEPLTTGYWPWIIGFIAAVALFACVTLHELGHSVAALHYGIEVESITLWLLGGIAKPAEMPRNWVQEFWIAIAGPLVNILILGVCGVAFLFNPASDVLMFLIVYLALLNIVLVVFNMMPAFPLDGGRVLRALLARNQPYVRATRQAASIGKGFAFLMGLFGLFTFNFFLMAIALFVYIAATSETRQMMLDAAFEGVQIGEVMTPEHKLTTVEVDVPLSDMLDIMMDDRHIGYPVLDNGRFVGLITLDDIQSSELTDGVVAGAMTPVDELETVTRQTEVVDAFRTLSSNRVGRLPVVNEDGQLIGIITRTDLMRAFRIVMERKRFERQEVGTSPRTRMQ